jgi:ribosomal protein S18 acetylase RimI-like enzyme
MEREESKTETQIHIRKAWHGDLDALAEVLAEAYDKDLLMNWIVFQDEKRIQRMRKYFEVALKDYSMKYDHVFTTEELDGVAIWYPPEPRNCWKASMLKQLSLVHKFIPISGIRKIPILLVADDMVHKHHFKEPHYYLSVIGVHPAHQGRGVASHLIRKVLLMCNERSVPAFLETATERNLGYYAQLDFKVIEEYLLPQNGPKVWTMIYEPKPFR